MSSLWYYDKSVQGLYVFTVWIHRWAKYIVKNDTAIKVMWFLGPTNTTGKHFFSSHYFHPRTSNIKTPNPRIVTGVSPAMPALDPVAKLRSGFSEEQKADIKNHQRGFSQKIYFYLFIFSFSCHPACTHLWSGSRTSRWSNKLLAAEPQWL